MGKSRKNASNRISRRNKKGRTKRTKRTRRTKRTKRNRRCQRGGVNYALVGQPIESNPNTWPGVAPNHGGNHYPLNTYENTPFQHLQSTQGGGRRKKRTFRRKSSKRKSSKRKSSKRKSSKRRKRTPKKRRQKGGSFFATLFPEANLVGQNISYNAGSALNTIKGYQAPVDPKPWVQPELLKVQQRMI